MLLLLAADAAELASFFCYGAHPPVYLTRKSTVAYSLWLWARTSSGSNNRTRDGWIANHSVVNYENAKTVDFASVLSSLIGALMDGC